MDFQQSADSVRVHFTVPGPKDVSVTLNKKLIISHKGFNRGKARRDIAGKSPSTHKESSAVK